MLTLAEFEMLVSAQPETIRRYIREGRIVADTILKTSENRIQTYFKMETVMNYARQFNWVIIDDTNRKHLFMQMIQQMDMNYSYKPVFLKAIFDCASSDGVADLSQVVTYFINYYADRRKSGLFVEKANSVFSDADCTYDAAEKVILKYPYSRFKTMQVLNLREDTDEIVFNKVLWGQLSAAEKARIIDLCDQKLFEYYSRFEALEYHCS